MTDETETLRKLGPVRSWLANLLVPGAGYLYVGRPQYAVKLLAFMFGSLFFICWTRLILVPWSFYLLGAILVLVPILIAPLHAAIIARRVRKAPVRHFNRLWIYVAYVAALYALFAVLSQNRAALLGYEPFRIPSSSMAPTIEKGDFILANSWAYRQAAPQRGDLVVLHRGQAADAHYLKRIVAIPGDTVAIKSGQLLINGDGVTETYLHPPRQVRPYGREFPPTELGPDQYFLLGDNRDNSADSRMWGPLRRDQIEAKAVYIWFSGSESDGIRWRRFPKLL